MSLAYESPAKRHEEEDRVTTNIIVGFFLNITNVFKNLLQGSH